MLRVLRVAVSAVPPGHALLGWYDEDSLPLSATGRPREQEVALQLAPDCVRSETASALAT